MAGRALKLTKNHFRNPYPSILRKLGGRGRGSIDDAIRYYVTVTIRIAKNSMRKAPKRPKSRFGQLKRYGRNTKRARQGKPYYWQRGIYSRPGHPPFWHAGPGNQPGNRSKASLKTMAYAKLVSGKGAKYIFGPVFLPQKSKPAVPGLHEHGGTKKVRTKSYMDPVSGNRLKRPKAFTARYPARPYMAPAMIKARKERKGGRDFKSKISKLGGMVATTTRTA